MTEIGRALALFRYALRNDARDSGELVALKRKMRASAVREAVFGMVFMVAVVVAWRHGWRPDLPWRRHAGASSPNQ